ncbi:MAG: hypothetical protein DRO39_03640 [Thermoprotei archaeon]|nr:MAG: hypothetical protein DRO39_03640 [Thermoprotei archaeon]
MTRDWTYRYFVEQSKLFLAVMESPEMVSRGARLAEVLAEYLSKNGKGAGSRILDVGCGTGRVAVPLAEKGFSVTCIDLSPHYIDIAEQKARRRGVRERMRFRVCDARRLKNCVDTLQPFDVVMFIWSTVIGYYDEETDEDILRQAAEVSKDDGFLIIADTVSRDYIAFLSSFVGRMRWFVDYGGYVVVEEPLYNPVTAKLHVKQTFYRRRGRDMIYEGCAHFTIRLYSLNELASIARRSGWCVYDALKAPTPTWGGYSSFSSLNVVFKRC